MAVFRIEKTRDYTVMSNHHLRDKSLSLKAKGLLSLMLSLPEEWDYTTKGLARICKDGVDSICAGVRELEEHGYVIRQRVRNPNGQLGAIEYTILEQPRPPEPKPKKPERENPAQLNTNRSSKEKSKKDLSSTEGSNPVQSIPPTPRARTGRDGTGCGSGRAIDGMAAGPYKFNVGGLRGAAEGGHQKLPIRLVWIADISRWPLSALT